MVISKNKKKICKICGKELNSGKTYCSRSCYWKKSPKKNVKCKQCGKDFLTYPSWQKNGQGFLCSKNCKHKWISEQYNGENSKAGFKNASIKINCKECGKEFTEFKSRIKDGRGVFCSKNCYNNWFVKNCSGEKSVNWKGGISFLPYSLDWTDTLKKSIRERDKYVCRICLGSGYPVHHIDYDKQNCNPDNLITLCESCHAKTGSNRDFWKEYLRCLPKDLSALASFGRTNGVIMELLETTQNINNRLKPNK